VAGVTIKTKATVGEARKIFVVRLFTGQQSGQNQIKNGGFMVECAGGYAGNGDISFVGQLEHGARQYSGAVIYLINPGFFDARSRHIIRIDRHATGSNNEIRTLI